MKSRTIMKKKTNLKDNQSGEVMLEAVIVLVPVIVLLLSLLSLSFLYYQEVMMNTVATELATDVAKNYKFTTISPTKNTISKNDYAGTKMFRMNFAKSSMEKAHEKRMNTYGVWRVALTSLGIDSEALSVDCEIDGKGIGRSVVEVTVSQKTTFFLSGVLELVGITEESTMFSATAYAECNDLMAYTSMINFTEFATSQLGMESINKCYNSFKDLIENLME
ncbi:MAG: hypothetical protein IJC90_02420 [Clostridia bacterium]|nr:hypothetical protein [Clostridia bacterium]